MTAQADVVIIGAGLSGLAAATFLSKCGFSAIVLEARDRVGGRTCSQHRSDEHGPYHVDVGGAYVGPGQNRILRVADELGHDTYKVYTKGKTVVLHNGQRQTYDGLIPPLSFAELIDLNRILADTEKLQETVNLEHPWETPNARELDLMSIHEWVNRKSWMQSTQKMYQTAVTSLVTQEPYQVSFLAWLTYVKSGGGVNRIMNVENGAQERKLVNGTQALSEGLVQHLGPTCKVLLNHVVTHIAWNTKNPVTVTTKDHGLFEARYVIVAISPSLYHTITFSPPMPQAKRELARRMKIGSIIKTVTYFERPFWRERGFNGSIVSDSGPVSYSIDDTKPDGSHPAIMGFVLANKAVEWSNATVDERRAAIASQYKWAFNLTEDEMPIGYAEKNWNDEEFSQGCYSAVMTPGLLTDFGPELRAPMDRIHFAGTETAIHWNGYMDGAVEAGEREAFLIAKNLLKLDQVKPRANGIKPDDLWREIEPPNTRVPPTPYPMSWVERNLPSLPVAVTLMSLATLACVGLVVYQFQP